jgi:ferredoxin
MKIQEIYEHFDRIGCLTFSTWAADRVESRIAHFFAYDDDGLYFRTMNVKPFYEQLSTFKTVSVCGMYPQTQLGDDENNLPRFVPGYTVRISGDVRELPMAEVEQKAKTDRNFNVAVYDIEKYPATRIFVLYKAKGEVYDFDYAMEDRDHKLLRAPFAYGGAVAEPAGLYINENCIACGACKEACTFKAITAGTPYRICRERCDECGNCYEACPVNAIELRNR